MAASNEKTINDFGEQWTHFTENDGYYASASLFKDIVGDAVDTSDLKGRRVADIGSGTGRIVRMLLACGVSHVTAVEPSDAFEVLVRNCSEYGPDRLTAIKTAGDMLPGPGLYDYVFSIGVIHHIPDPDPVIKAALAGLKNGGRLVLWLYGNEGNGLYIAFVRAMRLFTTLVPHGMLKILSRFMCVLAEGYGWLCAGLPLPMHKYFRSHFNKLSHNDRVLTVYDQLNPAYARYYYRTEAADLLTRNGFSDVNVFRRHGYSWIATGVKQASGTGS